MTAVVITLLMLPFVRITTSGPGHTHKKIGTNQGLEWDPLLHGPLIAGVMADDFNGARIHSSSPLFERCVVLFRKVWLGNQLSE